MAKNFLSGLFGKKPRKSDTQDEPLSLDEPPKIASEETDEPQEAAPQEITQQLTDAASVDVPVTEEIPSTTEPELPSEKPEPSTAPVPEEKTEKPKKGWLSRLTAGLSKSSEKLTSGVAAIFTKRKLDDDTLEELQDLLITADLGVPAAVRITTALARDKFDKEISDEEVREALAKEVSETLAPLAQPLLLDRDNQPTNAPHIILMIGVNGAGKTTTIGKLAQKFQAQNKSVMLAAGDTFRAAAIEQLAIWGERTGAPVISREVGSDAASLAFEAVKEAQAAGTDILIIDTAGRLQNKSDLMDELAKIVRVLKKLDATAPHEVILVLDATVGQNAISQAQVFSEIAGVTGLVMTKLDGTARGGVLVALGDKFALPIHYIGVGEGVDDLQPFHAENFARALAGIDKPST